MFFILKYMIDSIEFIEDYEYININFHKDRLHRLYFSIKNCSGKGLILTHSVAPSPAF